VRVLVVGAADAVTDEAADDREAGALDEVLTGWVLGQLPDKDGDIAEAERNIVALLVDGLAVRP